jgi:hypothetical protein
MATKTSVSSSSRSKRKPTRSDCWPDADSAQNETVERNENVPQSHACDSGRQFEHVMAAGYKTLGASATTITCSPKT